MKERTIEERIGTLKKDQLVHLITDIIGVTETTRALNKVKEYQDRLTQNSNTPNVPPCWECKLIYDKLKGSR